MKSASQHEQHLRETLDALETALGTPVVPGELPTWVRSVRQAFRPASDYVQTQLVEDHREQFSTIADEDPELLRRVEQLHEEDEAILEDTWSLETRIDRLATKAAKVEPHESKADDDVTELVVEGLAFVARVRKQETTVTTWLMEAFQRDRGIAD